MQDELIRIKSTGNQVDPSAGYSTGWNARRSLNVSKYSLHHPLILPHVDDDGDEEMEIVDETEQATVPSNEDYKSTTPIERILQIVISTLKKTSQDGNDGQNLQLVPVDDKPDKPKQLVPKAVEKVLTGAIRREMTLEELCTRQDSEINQLNHLQQYNHERECNLIIGQIRDDKILRLESLMDGILSAEEFKDEELASLKIENMILKENYENQPEVLRT
ncbi:kinesin-like protein KIN-12B [Tanacetum coccineum]